MQRSIWAGEKVTGATVFRIVRAMDAGPILAQSTVEIGAHETAGELLNRLAEDGSHLLAASLQAMADDQIAPVEQSRGGSSDSGLHTQSGRMVRTACQR